MLFPEKHCSFLYSSFSVSMPCIEQIMLIHCIDDLSAPHPHQDELLYLHKCHASDYLMCHTLILCKSTDVYPFENKHCLLLIKMLT